jgi:hypothetical protein
MSLLDLVSVVKEFGEDNVLHFMDCLCNFKSMLSFNCYSYDLVN